jgi:hypothetical protein
MRNERNKIWTIVRSLNDTEANGGGLWLPNIQRPFVWSEEQIERLFDSIMREYPISTLLVWRTKSNVKHRRFIDQWRYDTKVSAAYVMQDEQPKGMVLDGQQRLQSLFIGLRGSYDSRELYFDVTSGESTLPEDVRYRFRFISAATAAWPWIRFKDILIDLSRGSKLPMDVADHVLAKAPPVLSESDRRRVQRSISRAHQEFMVDENISYQLLDGVDDPEAYSIDDVVEIFIRANAGGTKLGKSDLLFSLLASDWDVADEAVDDLLAELNATGYAFDRDWVLKCCLVMLGQGAKYEVRKFRDPAIREEFIAKWKALSGAIKGVRDFLFSRTSLRTDKAVPSYIALIPLVYFRYHFGAKWDGTEGKETYILRTMLAGAFSGTPDNLLDRCTKAISEAKAFVLDELFRIIRDDGRSLELTSGSLLDIRYGRPLSHLLFNLWYRDFDYHPALQDNLPQQDHIFPQWALREEKKVNPATGRMVMKYDAVDRDQIANLALLTAKDNGFTGKSGELPETWLPRQTEAFREQHLIPKDPALWKLSRYGDFIAERQKLILEKFKAYLQTAPIGDST